MSSKRRLIQLILDFDGTLTKKDTLHLVAQAGYNRQQARNRSDLLTPWSEIVDSYMVDYERHAANYKPEKHLRTTFESETAWLNSLKLVENDSAQRVYSAGIFDDLRAQDIRTAAADAISDGQMQFRSGWFNLLNEIGSFNEALATAEGKPANPAIVSVNWSRHFIWNAIKYAAANIPVAQKPDLSSTMVFANEIPSIIEDLQRHSASHQQQPGGTVRDLRTSGDKVEAMDDIIKKSETAQARSIVVYIGDSVTDLQCLMSSDVGICIRDDPLGSGQRELSESLERLQVPVKHITECDTLMADLSEPQQDQSRHLWWCRDLQEVADWIRAASG